MLNLRIFLLMLVVVLSIALLAAVVAPRIGMADGMDPTTPVGAYVQPSAGAVTPGRIAGPAGVPHQGVVGPAPVLLAECEALPCLLELTIDGRPGYMIVSPPLPRG